MAYVYLPPGWRRGPFIFTGRGRRRRVEDADARPPPYRIRDVRDDRVIAPISEHSRASLSPTFHLRYISFSAERLMGFRSFHGRRRLTGKYISYLFAPCCRGAPIA